jgi:hypothetical protein
MNNTDSTGAYHGQLEIQVWAINPKVGQGVPLTLANSNPLSNIEYMFYGDSVITNGSVTAKTNGNFAGAVWSIKQNSDPGFEYVDQRDQGRLSQTAVWAIPAGEGHSPDTYTTLPDDRDLLRYNLYFPRLYKFGPLTTAA